MAQERIDNRYTPNRGRDNLMYNGMDTHCGENSRNMADMPAGDNRNYQNNMQREEGGSSAFGFNSPPPINFDTEEMRGSMQNILSKNIGEYVVIEFLIGTGMIMRKQGILYYVGTSYVTLYDNRENNFIVCDIFSVKFVYFFFPGDRPDYNFNVLREEEAGQMMQNNQNDNQMISNQRRQNMRR